MRVGVFDSGLGGLTVIKAIVDVFKGAQLFYVADTAFAPYGEKSNEEIINRCLTISEHLKKEHQIDVLIVACNTATSSAIKVLRQKYKELIVIGIEPGLKPAINLTKSGNIGVLATSATLNGNKYQDLASILFKDKDFKLYEQACIGLVEQIEDGLIDEHDTKKMLEDWLMPMREAKVDTIVLGCTHYPLVSHLIKEIMYDEIYLVETGYAIANRLKELSFEKGHKNEGELSLLICHTGNINSKMIDIIFKDYKKNENFELRKCEI